MGTADFAVPALRAVARSCDVVLVVTQPDRPRGRGQQLGPSPVAEEARALGLAVAKPVDVNEPEWRERLAGLGLDLVAVVAYGAILAPELLGVPRLGCVNLHGSLLPDYRGASPVQRALWDGRIGTGATTLWMDEGIDTGDCILQRWVGIEPADNAGTLSARLAEVGGPLLAETLLLAHAGKATAPGASRWIVCPQAQEERRVGRVGARCRPRMVPPARRDPVAGSDGGLPGAAPAPHRDPAAAPAEGR